MAVSDPSRLTALNRAAWDASAPHHAQGPDWHALRGQIAADHSVLDDTLTPAPIRAGVKAAHRKATGFPTPSPALSKPPSMRA